MNVPGVQGSGATGYFFLEDLDLCVLKTVVDGNKHPLDHDTQHSNGKPHSAHNVVRFVTILI